MNTSCLYGRILMTLLVFPSQNWDTLWQVSKEPQHFSISKPGVLSIFSNGACFRWLPPGLFVGCWGTYLLQTTESSDHAVDMQDDPVLALQKHLGLGERFVFEPKKTFLLKGSETHDIGYMICTR